MNRPEVMRYLGGVQTPEEWSAAYQRIIGFQRDYGHTFWIIEDRDGGDILGFCGLKRVNAPGAGDLTGKHEIGWRLAAGSVGQGHRQGSGDRQPRPRLRPLRGARRDRDDACPPMSRARA